MSSARASSCVPGTRARSRARRRSVLRRAHRPRAELRVRRRAPAGQRDAAVGHQHRRAGPDARPAGGAPRGDADGQAEHRVERRPAEVRGRVDARDGVDRDEVVGRARRHPVRVGPADAEDDQHDREDGQKQAEAYTEGIRVLIVFFFFLRSKGAASTKERRLFLLREPWPPLQIWASSLDVTSCQLLPARTRGHPWSLQL